MRQQNVLRHVFVSSVLAAAVTAAGCSNAPDWQARTYPVEGYINVNGEAPEGAVVILKYVNEPPDVRLSTPAGRVDSLGKYHLTTYRLHDGAPLGEYAVTLLWQSGSIDRFGGQFDSVDEAVATVEIERGDNVIPDIILTGIELGDDAGPPVDPTLEAARKAEELKQKLLKQQN